MLKISNLEVRYGQIRALNNISIEIDTGKIVAIIGANGAGKTTLMMTIAGLLKPAKGELSYMGKPYAGYAYRVVANGVCLVPERRRLYANLTVRENLQMGAYLRKDKVQIQKDLDYIYSLFPIIRERLKQYAGTLSGGEQQMLAIARGMMSHPKLLLLDEPSLGLAPIMVENMFKTVNAIRESGVTVLLAEQNAYQALELADDAFVLETGNVVKSGTARSLLDDPIILKAYLGVSYQDNRSGHKM